MDVEGAEEDEDVEENDFAEEDRSQVCASLRRRKDMDMSQEPSFCIEIYKEKGGR